MTPKRAVILVRRAALAAIIAVSSTACASVPRGARGELKPASVSLEVTNKSWSDVVVYLVEGSVPTRLGSVPALRKAKLLVHRGAGPLRVVLRPTGSLSGYAPEPIWVGSGEVARLTVQPLLTTSELSLR